MSVHGLARRDRLTLLFGAAVVGTLATGKAALPRWQSWRDARADDASRLTADIATANGVQRLLPQWRDSARARSERLARLDSMLLHAPSMAIAGALLASRVEQLARDAGVTVVSQQIAADTVARTALRRASVRLTGTGGMREFAALVRAISTGDDVFTIRELSVSQADPMATAGRPESLRFELQVDALCVVATPGVRR